MKQQFDRHHEQNPDYTGLHFMTADGLEECWQLLRQSVHSVSYQTLSHLPGYAAWLGEQDWRPSYARHRRNLQLIGLNEPDKRWVLKNPSHLFALDAIMATYPDALIVQCHRPAETILASMCSLAAQTTAGWSETFTGACIGADQLDTWADGLARFDAARARHDQRQFYDLDYADFVADPLAAVAGIYAHFGIALTEDARAAMAADYAASQTGPRAPKHRYDLADYGLTVEAVRERFAGR